MYALAVPEYFGTIGAVVGLALLIGGAGVVAIGAFQKARIEALRQDNADLRTRDIDRQNHIKDLETDRDKLGLRMNAVESENVTLKELVLQRANVDAVVSTISKVLEGMTTLVNEVQRHNNEAEAVWTKMGYPTGGEGNG